MESDKDIDEERRLFYVAITRARKHLVLSFASSRYRYGQVVYNRPSRFLEEISEANYDKPSLVLGRPVSDDSAVGPRTPGRGVELRKKRSSAPTPPPGDFKAANADEIQEGMEVLHFKFGKGKVLKIDGRNESRVATIYFGDIDNPQRRIMLRFAKLHIL